MSRIYVLGGYQTDFARNLAREGTSIADLVREVVQGGLERTSLDASDVQVGHVGNFIGELTCRQGNLGGLFVEADAAFDGLPTSRHEGACASGSLAALAAGADLEAGRYQVACVLGVEILRNQGGGQTQRDLGVAAWSPRETEGVEYPWPALFSRLGDAYAEQHGLDRAHLVALAQQAFANAKRNPNAQTRGWSFDDTAFDARDDVNPAYAPRVRRQDCSQITDGGACVFLATEPFARAYAARRGVPLSSLARLEGWGHRTGRMALDDKLAARDEYLLPQLRGTVLDAFRRAAVTLEDVDAVEAHDCFTTTAYAAVDHLGYAAPGQAFRAIEDGSTAFGGRRPLNPGGGLIGTGHPVGATGVRMLLDAFKQVTGAAGDYQVPNARRVATLNLGGSATTCVTFVVGRAA